MGKRILSGVGSEHHPSFARGVRCWNLRVAAIIPVVTLGAFTATADSFPLNDSAKLIGDPKIEFVRQGVDRGPVTITMPDGDILHGYYRVDRNGAMGLAFSGGQSATALAIGDGNVQFVARGAKTEMLCAAHVGFSGHGEGKCQTVEGALWAVSF